MKKLLWPAMLVGMLTMVAATASAQERECAACDRATELQRQIEALPDDQCDQARFDLESELASTLVACERRAHDCDVTLTDALRVIDEGVCRGAAVSSASDALCERICTRGGHGTWRAADDDHERPWCQPASGYRIVNRCRPVVRPRRPRTDTPRPVEPPPSPRVTEAVCGRIDTDDDGVPDMQWATEGDVRECVPYDNCRITANGDQADADNDGEGDACDDADDLAHWRELLRQHCTTSPRTPAEERLCRDAPAIVGTPDAPPAAALPSIADTLNEYCESPEDPGYVCEEIRRLSAEVTDLHEQDRLILSRVDCHDRGRRIQGIVTDERAGTEGTPIREDRVVCAEECVIDGARFNSETGRCELPPAGRGPSGPRPEVERLELDVGPYYSYLSDVAHMAGLEASLSVPLGAEWVRVRPYLFAGGAFASSHLDGDTFVGGGGVDLEFELVEAGAFSLSLGIGPQVMGTVATGQTRWPFAFYGGAATLRAEIGDGPHRFGLFVRGNVGGCDTAWTDGVNVCGGVTAGIGFHTEF